ncbi:MAG: carotenoid 1,2-hydratase, partial [Caldilineaceae bacterium]|nr:carotenoid 1,2-hydratase [Caldilineaceae bacterium]
MVLVACAGGGSGSPVVRSTVVDALAAGNDLAFARPGEPMAFDFPKDHGPHPEYRTEWWYFTGNLTDAQENEFGYQLTFFRS